MTTFLTLVRNIPNERQFGTIDALGPMLDHDCTWSVFTRDIVPLPVARGSVRA